MKWRDPKETPKNNQLVWIMTNPHKQTAASLELHCGWVFTCRDQPRLWGIENSDECGSGSTTWLVDDFSILGEKFIYDDFVWNWRAWSENIAAWIPANEFIYPDWVKQFDGADLDKGDTP